MLSMTPAAATALTRTRKEHGAPDDFGVRFFATPAPGPDEVGLAFTFVDSAEPDDVVLDGKGIDACAAPEIESLVGDVVIDATERDGRMDLVVRRTAQQEG
jgi:Fe-S cluster assembly iron-binding protein IscA